MVLVTSWKEGQQEVTPVHAVNSQRVTNEEKGWKEMEFSVVFDGIQAPGLLAPFLIFWTNSLLPSWPLHLFPPSLFFPT